MSTNVADIFGSMVFDQRVMIRRLPHETYLALKKTIEEGLSLRPDVANIVANAMKDWAIEKGATHYTHWFQPMTGITAEKHDSFITPTKEGTVIMEFSGKELVKGEPDASSFPSGGLRATFEARGYTAWDPTSYAFIKDGTLCIPTAFCSYTGEALDKKTPLLRSMEALNHQALRILRLFGKTEVRRVNTTVGAEQEYFLIDKAVYDRRPDLKLTERTLFGARPSKGQEMEDHYFGALKPRVAAFMAELDQELWKLGVLAKTKHNEAAPSQHELAPIFTTTNIASDHNQLTMEVMKKVATRHGLVCLLHEKPFAGVNGSGKHNNWSMSTDTGKNLLDPGDNPSDNAQFLLFLCAVIKAVDEYQDLLRISAASAANDLRFGANEAPPTIVSIFLGDELTGILEAIDQGLNYDPVEKTRMEIGVTVLPSFPRDTTDRNRTSPFAFTGNKFEFRMLGSAFSLAGPNIIMNTIVADELMRFADELEGAADFTAAMRTLIRRTISDHKRIVFNGNNYTREWAEEAARRGLPNYRSTSEALPHFTDAKNVELFARHGIFTAAEINSRREILLASYCKVIHIEALTMLDMVRRDVLPAVIGYTGELTAVAVNKKQMNIDCSLEVQLASRLSAQAASIAAHADALENEVQGATAETDSVARAKYHRGHVFAAMEELRAAVDTVELAMPAKCWPYPTYAELLFSV